jgi:alpha-glucoside transport system substrate-binding protein
MTRYRLVALATIVALVLGACADTPDEAAETTQASTETTAATTTTAPPDDTTETTEAMPEGPYEFLARAQAGEYAGATVEILGQWVDGEAANFTASLQPFVDATGIEVSYEGITDYETVLSTRVDGGNAPDIAQIAQPGLMRSFASEGSLVSLGDWFNTDQLGQDYIQSFIDLGSLDGELFGIFLKGDL